MLGVVFSAEAFHQQAASVSTLDSTAFATTVPMVDRVVGRLLGQYVGLTRSPLPVGPYPLV
jgi:hypothetical protein